MNFLSSLLFLIAFQDPQQAMIYDAERHIINAPDIVVLEFAQIRGYTARVYSDPWFRQRYPKARMPQVVRGVLGQNAYSVGNTIAFPERACNFHVLHEIAHQLTPNNGHGPRFARVLVDLVEHFMGERDAIILRKLYMERNINWLQRPNGL